MRSTFRKGVAAVIGAAALSVILSSTAVADSGVLADANDAVGVGSDTTEYALNALAAAYNPTVPAGGVLVHSFNATVPAAGQPVLPTDTGATIVPRSGATAITRPNGSSAGITELKRAGTATTFARSSRARQASDNTGTAVLFLPYATDGLRYARSTSPASNAPVDLTNAELKKIYECNADGNPATPDLWSNVRAGLPAVTILPVLPQSGSGTRSFFLTEIGVTSVGSCVNQTAQEHDPAAVAGNANKIAPFSTGRYSILPPAQQSTIVLNTGGFTATRSLFNVVRDVNGGGVLNKGVDAGLHRFFGDGTGGLATATNNWICSSAATSVIAAQGFTQLSGTACGKVA
ncbi:substrate-binding domain-containing protein [Actinokineospora auranticolor]|uniref:ABC-type phosphate transport system substrate-binding protein n=1 Tax=Actinokineospora auranticolor TaxID=155976 RepID=A0A2S6GI72_9PSEU|nr:substrate-binding domain-containing protein [Actinokineospora auranticolor]PPK64861.1 ABC-type phosphate transport system substrate-binding protein [Actinokineospora auranticolor]